MTRARTRRLTMTDPYADLPPVGYLDEIDTGATLVSCSRCASVVREFTWGDHERWHAALDQLAKVSHGGEAQQSTAGLFEAVDLRRHLALMTARYDREAARVDDYQRETREARGELDRAQERIRLLEQRATRSEKRNSELVAEMQRANDLIVELRKQLEAAGKTVEQQHRDVRVAMGATSIVSWSSMMRMIEESRVEGFWPGEIYRLRRVEAALVELGAPDSSTKDDPGGPMIAWIRQLHERPSRDTFAAVCEQRDELERRRQECAEKHTPVFERPVTTVDMRLALPDGWETELENHGRDDDCAVPFDTVVRLVREWATHVCEAHCTRHDDEPRDDRPAETLPPATQIVGIIAALEQTADKRWAHAGSASSTRKMQLTHQVKALREAAELVRGFVGRDAAESPAAEPCTSLYLHDGRLLACDGNKGHVPGHGNYAANIGWQYGDCDEVLVPWPLDQEPPAGIDILRDTDSKSDYLRYLCRVSGGWMWTDKPAVPHRAYAIQDWDTVALDADGDLHVVRPE